MRNAKLYYKDTYLGTLYESGVFDYTINSNHSEDLDVEKIIHILEVVRKSGLTEGFNFDEYVNSWNNFQFKDGFEFR